MTTTDIMKILKPKNGYQLLFVHLTPNSSKDEIIGIFEGRLKVKVRAIPEKGKANQDLIKLLSKRLSYPKSVFEIAFGGQSRRKTLKIFADFDELLNRLKSTL